VHRAHEPVPVGHALLEQVRESRRALRQQRDGILGVVVLGQHHDPRPGMPGKHLLGGCDALVGERRGHPDIGDDHVGYMLVGCCDQAVVVLRHRDHVKTGPHGQQRPDPLADQDVVIGEEHAQHIRSHVRCCGAVVQLEVHPLIGPRDGVRRQGTGTGLSGGGGTGVLVSRRWPAASLDQLVHSISLPTVETSPMRTPMSSGIGGIVWRVTAVPGCQMRLTRSPGSRSG
jgi:hypothetical protein